MVLSGEAGLEYPRHWNVGPSSKCRRTEIVNYKHMRTHLSGEAICQLGRERRLQLLENPFQGPTSHRVRHSLQVLGQRKAQSTPLCQMNFRAAACSIGSLDILQLGADDFGDLQERLWKPQRTSQVDAVSLLRQRSVNNLVQHCYGCLVDVSLIQLALEVLVDDT